MFLKLVLAGFPETIENWNYDLVKKAASNLEQKFKLETLAVMSGVGLLFSKEEERKKFLKGL